MANILIYSNNPQLAAEWMHALVSDHSVNRLLNARTEYHADAVIFDARKLDEDTTLLAVLANPNTRFLIMGSNWPEQKQIEVMVHGAAGYCEESEAALLLKRAVDCILKGDIWIRRALVPKVIGVLTGQLQSNHNNHLTLEEREKLTRMSKSLSAREIEVANMIRLGENNRCIAEAMNISERTVKAHLSSIFRKFEVDDRLRLAIRLKEIDQYR
ncbi:MAG: response regulator transcription factor [Methylomonas sp.]|uniref:helix-turn-helix transcriptional regulator n=1 Tax=Methylomonas sp. TaxID=418 RepID=UPI0025E46ACC|nr:response regulator transcription factor [Methylomonas sp.]MCK9607454.1 response regulator transcription factor [Methylomonas sp.]